MALGFNGVSEEGLLLCLFQLSSSPTVLDGPEV